MRNVKWIAAAVFLLSVQVVHAQETPFFALQWSDPKDPGLFEYQTAMVRLGESGWINMLKRHPKGRRAIVVTHPHNSIWNNADDRCRNAEGSLEGLSQDPRTSSNMFKNTTGNDGLASGYSCPWLDGWSANEMQRMQPFVDELVANGIDLNFLIFDVESKIDWLKLNGGWRRAIQQDPRWAEAKPVLDSLKQVATGNPNAVFDFEGGTVDGHAWNAYMWAQQARALNDGVFNVFRAAYPELKGSNYEHHARRAHDTTLETYGWEFYQTEVTGTHSSDYYYGWLIQVEDAEIGTRVLDNKSDWLTFLFEQRKARASVRSGFPIQPWICYSGNRNIDWRVYPGAPASHTPNPFWEENIRHLLLLNADPLLYWNSRSYSKTDHSTDELDGFVERLLEEVNARVGTSSPRHTITREALSWTGEKNNELGIGGRLSDGAGIVATGLRHGSEATYRIAVERLTNVPDQWPAVEVRVLRDGVDTGTRVTIPAGQSGAFFTTGYIDGSVYTFDFVPAPVPNMVTVDMTDALWDKGGDPFGAISAEVCPVDGVPVISLYDKSWVTASAPAVEVVPGRVYTFSAYLKGRSSSGRGGVRLSSEAGESLISYVPYNREQHGWARLSVTFVATTNKVQPNVTGYRQYACAPALHEGSMPGRVEPGVVFTREETEQRIQLQQGLNLIALNVDPGNISPDSLLREHPGVSLVRDVNGDSYSARFDIREIQAWDARTAYRVLADEPSEIVLKGRPLRMDGIQIESGWNLIPFVHTQPLNLDLVAAAYPGVLLRVEDDRGNVYEHEKAGNTLTELEPGRAYRVYAAQSAYLVFSP